MKNNSFLVLNDLSMKKRRFSIDFGLRDYICELAIFSTVYTSLDDPCELNPKDNKQLVKSSK